MLKEPCRVIDTYPDFSTYWKKARSKDTDERIKLWQTTYMREYSELLAKQARVYEEACVHWQEIARKLFPLLPQRLPLMRKARDNIIAASNLICTRASEKLELTFNITLVIYIGIGCGAGWATTYNRQPAILLGLENIAEEKWHTKNKIKALISHEIGHLVHMKWRNEWTTFEKAEQDPLFRLYSEGFAQRCEHIILGKETWHMAPDKYWLSWCRENKNWLAKEFLIRTQNQASVDDFFGSWFNIKGKKQTGYFLGHELIREAQKTQSLKQIALLTPQEARMLSLKYLKHIDKQH
jgi:hypothetical protein